MTDCIIADQTASYIVHLIKDYCPNPDLDVVEGVKNESARYDVTKNFREFKFNMFTFENSSSSKWKSHAYFQLAYNLRGREVLELE